MTINENLNAIVQVPTYYLVEYGKNLFKWLRAK